jgi:hypothetical protein
MVNQLGHKKDSFQLVTQNYHKNSELQTSSNTQEVTIHNIWVYSYIVINQSKFSIVLQYSYKNVK